MASSVRAAGTALAESRLPANEAYAFYLNGPSRNPLTNQNAYCKWSGAQGYLDISNETDSGDRNPGQTEK